MDLKSLKVPYSDFRVDGFRVWGLEVDSNVEQWLSVRGFRVGRLTVWGVGIWGFWLIRLLRWLG